MSLEAESSQSTCSSLNPNEQELKELDKNETGWLCIWLFRRPSNELVVAASVFAQRIHLQMEPR